MRTLSKAMVCLLTLTFMVLSPAFASPSTDAMTNFEFIYLNSKGYTVQVKSGENKGEFVFNLKLEPQTYRLNVPILPMIKVNLTTSGATVDIKAQDKSTYGFIGEVHANMQSIEFAFSSGMKDIRFGLNNLKLDFQSQLTKGTNLIDATSHFALEKFHIKDIALGPISFDIDMANVNGKKLNALMRRYSYIDKRIKRLRYRVITQRSQSPDSSITKLDEQIKSLEKEQEHLLLAPFTAGAKMKFKHEFHIGKDYFKMDFDFTFAKDDSLSGELSMNTAALLNKSKVKGLITITQDFLHVAVVKVFNAFPPFDEAGYNKEIEWAVKKGLLKKQGDLYISDITIKDGKVTVNGITKPLPKH